MCHPRQRFEHSATLQTRDAELRQHLRRPAQEHPRRHHVRAVAERIDDGFAVADKVEDARERLDGSIEPESHRL